MRSHFDAEGEIRGTDLLGALVALWREGASGTLQFSRSGATAGFDIAAGDVVRTASSDPRFDTAAILVRAGKLDQPTLDRLPVGEGGDRAAVALQTGVLTRREWRWGEKIRAVEVLSDLLTWLEGDYWFFRTGAQDSADFRLTIPRLVLELFLRSRDRNLVLHYLGGADVPLARAAAFDAEFPSFGLTADAESVVQLIDGQRTAEEIASEAPADAFAVEKLLAALVTLGLVHPEFAPGEAPPGPIAARAEPPREDPAEPASETAPPPSAVPEGEAEREAEREERALEDEEERVADEELGEQEEEGQGEEEREEPGDHDDGEERAAAGADEREHEDTDDRAPGERAPAWPRSRDGEDEAERDLAGGSFEEQDAADRYRDEHEPEPADDRPGLGDQELDRDRADSGHHALDDEQRARDPEAIEEEPARAAHEEAPADLLGLEEGGAPRSPFDRPLEATTGVGAERPRPRSVAPWIWVLAVLAVAVLAVLIWRSRESGPAEGPARVAAGAPTSPTPIQLSATAAAPAVGAVQTPEPSPTAMHIGPAARPSAAPAGALRMGVPSAAAPGARAATPVPTPRPAASPRAAAPTIPPSPRPKAAPPASESSRQTWLDRAERDRKRYVQGGKAKFAIQLELACEVPSLVDAFQHDRPAGSMWVLASPFEGRTCFRVLWGRYATRQEAARGLARAPAFFSTPRNHPAVVPVR